MNDSDMRTLWPAGKTRKLEKSVATVPNIPKAVPIASGAQTREFKRPLFRYPVTSYKTSGYFRYYVEGTGTYKLVAPAGPASNVFAAAFESDTALKENALVLKYEKQISDNVTFEGNLAPTRQAYHKLASGDWKGAAKEMLSVHLKGGGNLMFGFKGEWDVDVSPDEHFCFFGVSLKIQAPIELKDVREFSSSVSKLGPKGFSQIELEGTVNFRFGLSRKGWVYVARRTSGSALRAAAGSLPQAAARGSAIACLEAFAIPAMGAAAGAGLLYLSGAMCAYYSTKGARQGILTSYCIGYVVRIFEARTGHSGHFTRDKKASRHKVAASEHYMAGYDDASNAIKGGPLKVNAVEAVLLKNFGTAESSMFRGSRGKMLYGNTIDKEYEEARLIGEKMAKHMVSNLDEFGKFVGITNVGWQWF